MPGYGYDDGGESASALDEFQGSITFPSTPLPSIAFLLIPNPSGPAGGDLWDIRSYEVAGAGVLTALRGRVDLYIGPPPQGVTGSTVADNMGLYWIDSTAGCTPPCGDTFSRYQRVVRPGQAIWAVVSRPSSGETYTFKGKFLSEPA